MSSSSDTARPSPPEPEPWASLYAALSEGDPDKVRALIEEGADIHYTRPHGYDAFLDAVHGRDVSRDGRLLELLALLVEHRVDPSGVSTYGESALNVLSGLGRFDGVRLLLDTGAERSLLGWTPLMEAVALGSIADVQAALVQGADLEARDYWSRTPWLIALLTGDIARASLLRDRGADPDARGHCGSPPLFYAIRGHHPEMLRWLLQHQADLHATDELGATPLMEAVEGDDLACVEILLDAGASVRASTGGTALTQAGSREMILRLLDAGADPASLSYEGQRTVLGLPEIDDEALAALSRRDARQALAPAFGRANPERMNVPFREAMIRCGATAYAARLRFEEALGSIDKPVWCARRFGQSLTLLPDGRAIQIGGEHEDHYDPDFCIYNDVFVHGPDGSVTIYGYPSSVFPPTDFHTATLLGGCIYVIGCLGYPEQRQPGTTPVFRLDLNTLRIDRIDTRGEAPGWIYGHRAVAISPHEIRVEGGEVLVRRAGGKSWGPSSGAFVLDVERRLWRRA
ncbi:MAG: ankyrin repeat domain-containing protein [Armatimonadota bacterium]